MEKVINQIISIEEQAQKIISEADTLRENLHADAQKSIDSLSSDIENRVHKKYETIQKTETDFADKRIEELKEKYLEAEKDLDRVYAEKKSEWSENIYKAVLGK